MYDKEVAPSGKDGEERDRLGETGLPESRYSSEGDRHGEVVRAKAVDRQKTEGVRNTRDEDHVSYDRKP